MRFSILAPVYNTAAYLTACAASVLSQSCADFELIFIDDGSTDGSGALCDALALRDARVRVVHTENRGLLAARRRGIAEAKGEICIALDSDDLLAPGALFEIDRRMQTPSAGMLPDLLIFNFACFTDPAGPFETEPPVFADGETFHGESGKAPLYEALVSGWTLNNFVTKAIRTALLRADETDYAPYYGCSHSEDLLQTLAPVTCARAVAYCALPLYLYRRNAQSMTRVLDASRIGAQFNRPVMEKLASQLPLWGMDTPAWRERLAVRELAGLLSVFRQAYRAAESASARRALLAFRWADMPRPAALAYQRSALLTRAERLQLSLVLEKGRTALRRAVLRILFFAADCRARLRKGSC